jgi:hypothetical protein
MLRQDQQLHEEAMLPGSSVIATFGASVSNPDTALQL